MNHRTRKKNSSERSSANAGVNISNNNKIIIIINSESVLENEKYKLLGDFVIQTDHLILTR